MPTFHFIKIQFTHDIFPAQTKTTRLKCQYKVFNTVIFVLVPTLSQEKRLALAVSLNCIAIKVGLYTIEYLHSLALCLSLISE